MEAGAKLPEVKKEEIKVTVENGVLVLSGEHKLERDEKDRKHHRIERAYGSFGRSFALPEDADAEKVNAEFNDGLLKLHIAKSEAARPKQIEVKVSCPPQPERFASSPVAHDDCRQRFAIQQHLRGFSS